MKSKRRIFGLIVGKLDQNREFFEHKTVFLKLSRVAHRAILLD